MLPPVSLRWRRARRRIWTRRRISLFPTRWRVAGCGFSPRRGSASLLRRLAEGDEERRLEPALAERDAAPATRPLTLRAETVLASGGPDRSPGGGSRGAGCASRDGTGGDREPFASCRAAGCGGGNGRFPRESPARYDCVATARRGGGVAAPGRDRGGRCRGPGGRHLGRPGRDRELVGGRLGDLERVVDPGSGNDQRIGDGRRWGGSGRLAWACMVWLLQTSLASAQRRTA